LRALLRERAAQDGAPGALVPVRRVPEELAPEEAAAFKDQLAPQMTAAGVPAQVVTGFGQASSSGALDFNKLTGVGDLGTAILNSIPAQFRSAIEPFIPQVVTGIHEAFSLAVAQTFWIGVGPDRMK